MALGQALTLSALPVENIARIFQNLDLGHILQSKLQFLTRLNVHSSQAIDRPNHRRVECAVILEVRGGLDQGGFVGSIRMAEEFAAEEPHVFLPAQFANDANVGAHQKTTGPEIWWQLYFHSLIPDAFVAGVGTGGTIMGAGKFLRERNPELKLHPLQPTESPTLSAGRKVGHHRIQGISDEFIPPILQLDRLDSVVSVSDGDAILMAQKLAAQLGLGVGISSGANFLGAIMVQDEMGDDAVVTTVFPDDNKKYLSTDLLKSEKPRADYLAPDIELLSFEALKRVCYTCFDEQ